MGSDFPISRVSAMILVFQSTLPAWGATWQASVDALHMDNFNPRSPHGERRDMMTRFLRFRIDFNPRSPHGERPSIIFTPQKMPRISIHAPRMGSDDRILFLIPNSQYFNPRSPHGERRIFQVLIDCKPYISIHAPRMGSDSKNMRFLLCFCNFH